MSRNKYVSIYTHALYMIILICKMNNYNYPHIDQINSIHIQSSH